MDDRGRYSAGGQVQRRVAQLCLEGHVCPEGEEDCQQSLGPLCDAAHVEGLMDGWMGSALRPDTEDALCTYRVAPARGLVDVDAGLASKAADVVGGAVLSVLVCLSWDPNCGNKRTTHWHRIMSSVQSSPGAAVSARMSSDRARSAPSSAPCHSSRHTSVFIYLFISGPPQCGLLTLEDLRRP